MGAARLLRGRDQRQGMPGLVVARAAWRNLI